MSDTTSVLVLGASGMLGNAVFRYLCQSHAYSVTGSVRSRQSVALLPQELRGRIVTDVDVENADHLLQLFIRVRPSVVINCIGLVKQLQEANDPLAAIAINSLLPHKLARMCAMSRSRFIHISTDCVFAGTTGGYKESDAADADDLYGRSKFLGEVRDAHAVTLRTSIIGPELNGAHGLLGWFLAQRGQVKGYRRAIFSGVPTVELARIIRDFVIPRPDLHGVLHVSSEPINKYELLRLIAGVYGVATRIEPDDQLVIDRSLDSGMFRRLTGYTSQGWPQLIQAMYEFG